MDERECKVTCAINTMLGATKALIDNMRDKANKAIEQGGEDRYERAKEILLDYGLEVNSVFGGILKKIDEKE